MTEHLVRARKRIEIREKHKAGVSLEELARAYLFMRLRKLSKGR